MVEAVGGRHERGGAFLVWLVKKRPRWIHLEEHQAENKDVRAEFFLDHREFLLI